MANQETSQIPVGLMELADAARIRFCKSPKPEQIVAVQTVTGDRLFLDNFSILSGSVADEDAFVSKLVSQNDTYLAYIVCMWSNGTMDVPSQHLRRLFLAMDAGNADAEVLLNGANCLNMKKLNLLQPPVSQG